jgi:hypothetical protein
VPAGTESSPPTSDNNTQIAAVLRSLSLDGTTYSTFVDEKES